MQLLLGIGFLILNFLLPEICSEYHKPSNSVAGKGGTSRGGASGRSFDRGSAPIAITGKHPAEEGWWWGGGRRKRSITDAWSKSGYRRTGLGVENRGEGISDTSKGVTGGRNSEGLVKDGWWWGGGRRKRSIVSEDRGEDPSGVVHRGEGPDRPKTNIEKGLGGGRRKRSITDDKGESSIGNGDAEADRDKESEDPAEGGWWWGGGRRRRSIDMINDKDPGVVGVKAEGFDKEAERGKSPADEHWLGDGGRRKRSISDGVWND